VLAQPHVILLTGTCGSGKSTVAELIARVEGWVRVSEDDIWPRLFGRDRSPFGTDEHRAKRAMVQEQVLQRVRLARASNRKIVLDATVHESPPEALLEYGARFHSERIPLRVCVLQPELSVAIARDAARLRGSLGEDRVASLYAKFTGAVLPERCFLNTSQETAEETATRVLVGGCWLTIVGRGCD
jgi:predicted kinase